MWWKLGALLILTAMLVLSVIPIQTHAVLYDPAQEPPPPRLTFWNLLGNMYLTPSTAVLILIILGLGAFVALKVIRGHW